MPCQNSVVVIRTGCSVQSLASALLSRKKYGVKKGTQKLIPTLGTCTLHEAKTSTGHSASFVRVSLHPTGVCL